MPKQSKPARKGKAGSEVEAQECSFFAAVPQGAPASSQDQDPASNIYIYNNTMLGNIDDIDKKDIPQDQEGKGPFDAKEWIFLENYILEKKSAISSMKSAGYEGYSDRWLTVLARKIVIRYEGWAGDARKVFRQAGVGEVRLARECDKLLRDGSERSRLGAMDFAGKVLRASSEPEASSGGVQININIVQGVCAPGQGAPLRPQEQDRVTGIPTPTKPLQITK